MSSRSLAGDTSQGPPRAGDQLSLNGKRTPQSLGDGRDTSHAARSFVNDINFSIVVLSLLPESLMHQIIGTGSDVRTPG